MKLFQVSQLLTIASGFDRRQVDELTATAWWEVLKDVDYDDARAVVINHATTSSDYLTVKHVIDGVKLINRATPAQVTADVRAARARQIVGRDWPENRALNSEDQARLTAARERDRLEAIAYSDDEPGQEVELGDVGRRV